jgi:hypothetical protein
MMRLHQILRASGSPQARRSASPRLRLGSPILLAAALAGCSADSSFHCRSDNDCGGSLCVNGVCRPLAPAPDLSSGTMPDGAVAADLAQPITPPADGGLALDALAASCSFNSDGVIQRSEAPFLVGLGALYAVNPSGSTVPVNLTPAAAGWDFSAAVANESKIFDQILSPSGQWWSADFPSASYAEKLEDGQPILGVYRAAADRLELLGLVSEQSGFQKTELTYATPISILRFPISVGDHFTAGSDLSGTLDGFAFFGHDSYDITVDKRANTKVPAGSFDTLRLRINYTQTVGLVDTTRITYLHLTECYGAVARVRSQDNEPSNDFTQAVEYRRLATQ